jgi:hypothetical protein
LGSDLQDAQLELEPPGIIASTIDAHVFHSYGPGWIKHGE